VATLSAKGVKQLLHPIPGLDLRSKTPD